MMIVVNFALNENQSSRKYFVRTYEEKYTGKHLCSYYWKVGSIPFFLSASQLGLIPKLTPYIDRLMQG